MKHLNKTGLLLAVSLTSLLVAGCDYVPHITYEIKTIDGKSIKLSCPTIDPARSEFTYLYDKECYVLGN